MKPIAIAVAGCAGRMGRVLVPLAAGDARFALAAAVSRPDDPLLGEDAGVAVGARAVGVRVTAAIEAPCDVLLDFTLPDGCAVWADWCAANRVAMVSGTTGLDAAQAARVQAAAKAVPVVWAANMSVGVTLMLDLVEQAARRLGAAWDVEIVESHHRRKVDAPSGTARTLLDAVCAARQQASSDAVIHGREGVCGPRPRGQVGVHALRMGAVVGEHTVHFASESEVLTIQHAALSRATFAEGALQAAAWIVGRSPGLYSMRDVLGL